MPTNRILPASALGAAVVRYCDAIAVPAFDERAIRSRRLDRAAATPRPNLKFARIAALCAAAVCALFVSAKVPAVVAEIELALQGFTSDRGAVVPMTVREVDIDRARADMPFTVIEPPSIAGTNVTIHEAMPAAATQTPSLVFDLDLGRGGPPVSIIEDAARATAGKKLFLERAPGAGLDDRDARALSEELLVHGLPHGLRARVGAIPVTPESWIARGTRIAVLDPSGALTSAQVRAMRAAMQ